MKLTVIRSGGFAGMTRTWEVEVPEPDAADRWLPLLKHGDGAPRREPSGRDTFQYHITLNGCTMTVDEQSLDQSLRELIELARRGN